MKFVKMHGIGNDYVYVNGFEERVDDPAALAVRVSDRHKGIGSDGLVLLLPPSQAKLADVRMRMFNSDGSEAEMCGNAIRCVGKLAYELGLARGQELTVETASGLRKLTLEVREGRVRRATVDMGAPVWEAARIPVLAEGEALRLPLHVDGRVWHAACVSMGNPHAVIVTEHIDDLPLERLGPLFEHHPLFPRRINTEFVEITGPESLRMRVWERGAGETQACGTGACASACVAARLGLTGRRVTVSLKGGDLDIHWHEADDHVRMTGGATTVFAGTLLDPEDA